MPIRRMWPGPVLFVAAFLFFTGIHVASLQRYAPPPVEFDFTQPPVDHSPNLLFVRGWVFEPSGLFAPTGVNSLLALRFRKSRFEDFLVDLKPTASGRGKLELHVFVSSRFKTSPQNIPHTESADPRWHLMLLGSRGLVDATPLVDKQGAVNVSRLWPDGGECELLLRPRPGETGALVDSLYVQRDVWKWAKLLVPLLWLAVVSAVCSCAPLRRRAALACALAATLLVVVIVVWPVGLLDYGAGIVFVSASLATLPAVVKRGNIPWATLVLTLTFLAASVRFDELNEQRFEPLEPDAAGFREIAASSTYFYDAQHREPLFPFLLKLFLAATGDGPTQVRLFSFVMSVLLVPLTFAVGAELRGPLVGLIAAALIAGNDQWALHAPRGVRLEVFTALVLILTAAVFTDRRMASRRHVVWLGLSAAAVCLVRVTSLWFCLLGTAYAVARRGWSTRRYVGVVAITVLPIVPHWLYCSTQYGDPFHTVNMHIKFYRNQEFRGSPGMPTHAEVEADPYAGPDVSAFEFFFGTHGPEELVRRTTRQFQRMFFGRQLLELICNNSYVLMWWAIASYAVVAVLSKQRMMIIWMMLLVGPAAWLFADQSEPEWRTVFHVSAVLFIGMGLAVGELRDRAPREPASRVSA